MSRVRGLLAASGLAAQIVFFVGIGFLLSDLYGLRNVVTSAMEDDPMLLAPFVEETVVSYNAVYVAGLLGALLIFVLITRARYHDSWFLWGTRISSWLWMPLIPIGTLIGVVLLRSARRAAEERRGAE